MIPTDDLIAALAANLTPVRRLRPPLMRATSYLLLATLILIMIGLARGLRPDLATHLFELRFSLGLLGSILTGVLAAIAAFMVYLPGRSLRWLWLPVPALALWLSSIGYQCFSNWVPLVRGSAPPGATAACLATLVLTSVPLSLALGLMLRHAASLNPAPVIMAASLSVAGITATALTLFHPLDASLEILAFNIGTGLMILLFGGAINFFVARQAGTPA